MEIIGLSIMLKRILINLFNYFWEDLYIKFGVLLKINCVKLLINYIIKYFGLKLV